MVGVVGDIRVRGLERESEPQLYLPSGQARGLLGYAPKDLVINATVASATLMPAVRDIVKRADPQIPISDVLPLADIVDTETAPRRVQVGVLGSFAASAILLAAIGIHGLLAFSVSTRTREIGVRLALGTEPRSILGRVIGQGAMLGAIGVAIGVPLAMAAGRVMQAQLAGVSPADPVTITWAVSVCLLMTLGGSVTPALRVLRIDPVTAIRQE